MPVSKQSTRDGVLIFSRYDSARLPGKVLRDLGGRPLLGRCLDRARRRLPGSHVVVATSDRSVDDPIARFCADEGVACFRGDADDVAGRALSCLRHFGFERFARVCGDSPFFPDHLIARLLEIHRDGGHDVACNVHPRTFPPGASAEIVGAAAMERMMALGPDAAQREHCTAFFYDHPELFAIYNVPAPDAGWRPYRMVVDLPSDLELCNAMLARLGRDPADVEWDELFALRRQFSE